MFFFFKNTFAQVARSSINVFNNHIHRVDCILFNSEQLAIQYNPFCQKSSVTALFWRKPLILLPLSLPLPTKVQAVIRMLASH